LKHPPEDVSREPQSLTGLFPWELRIFARGGP
jgi:hypothetical protein